MSILRMFSQHKRRAPASVQWASSPSILTPTTTPLGQIFGQCVKRTSRLSCQPVCHEHRYKSAWILFLPLSFLSTHLPTLWGKYQLNPVRVLCFFCSFFFCLAHGCHSLKSPSSFDFIFQVHPFIFQVHNKTPTKSKTGSCVQSSCKWAHSLVNFARAHPHPQTSFSIPFSL